MALKRHVARSFGAGARLARPTFSPTMNDFRNLRVWDKAHALTLTVYRVTSTFPPDERFGLVAQARRAAVSVPANIAESCGRRSRRDEAHLLQIAFGSLCELEAELLLARDLGYLPGDGDMSLLTDLVEVKRMLATLAKRTLARAGDEGRGPSADG